MALMVRVGVDLAKNVIQIHAVDAAGRRVAARAIKRDQFLAWCAQLPAGCLVAMEACSGAHAWARRLRAQGLDARLIAANFVSPYRMEGKTGKNDMTDAAAVCEAASRPTMRFVPIKTAEQQGVMALHRVREGLKEERTACINRIRGVLSEFDLVFGKSPKVLRAVLADVIEDASNELPGRARLVVQRAFEHWQELDDHMKWCDRQIGAHVRDSEEAQRAAKVTGIGEIGASALTAGVGDFKQFKGGHQLSAWMGLVPGLTGRVSEQLTDPSNTESSLPKTCSRRCIDRSDRQPVNSTNPAWRQLRPTPWSEWSPTERFVSGSAPAGATRPFVDVQSVLCRTAPSSRAS